MAKKDDPYKKLATLSREIRGLQSAELLLGWDQETYMPPGGVQPRSEQIALLSQIIHEKLTSPTYKKNLEKLISFSTGKIKAKGLSLTEQAAVREWLREYTRLYKLPSSFVKTFSQTTSEAFPIWQIAKKNNQFALFAPFLEKIVELSRKKAEILGFEEHPYEALLKAHEPSMGMLRMSEIFSNLKKELTALLKKIREKPPIEDDFLYKTVPTEVQKELGDYLLTFLPIEKEFSRLDFSPHPFSVAMHPQDSRITTRILPKNFMSNLFSILHEVGHSLYEMGLPIETWGTPLSEAISLSIHESQSRWWETRIGRSISFLKLIYPMLKKKIPSLRKISFSRFYRALHAVTPSLIRVEADEVTYCLHVILRFEIERDLISQKIEVADLPRIWRQKSEELLGVTPENDSEGCLQDIHWAHGSFGYFPTYALGNLFAAQFFQAFLKEYPDWRERIRDKNLAFIREWLRRNIHCFGKRYDGDSLVEKVTGKPLSEKAYIRYLKLKYKKIYRL